MIRKTKKSKINRIYLTGPVWLVLGLYPLKTNSSLQIHNYLEIVLGVGIIVFLIFDRTCLDKRDTRNNDEKFTI